LALLNSFTHLLTELEKYKDKEILAMAEETNLARELAAVKISEKKLEEIFWLVKNPDGDELRTVQLSEILDALVETVKKKTPKEFRNLKKRIVDKVGSDEELNPLSKVLHYLADVIQDLVKKNINTGSVVEKFVSLIDALRMSGWESTGASVMIWRNLGGPTLHPNELKFQCKCRKETYFDVKINFERLAGLQHNTAATWLIQILNLGEYKNSTGHKFIISPNRSVEKELLADIGPAGFVYCGVQLTKEEETAMRSKYIDRPFQQRYGGCALRFDHGGLGKSENPECNFYKLGTKFYDREWSQLILVDSKRRKEIAGRKWKVVMELSKTFYTVERVKDTKEDPAWPWTLKYCGEKGCWNWTHPTLVFPEPLRLDKITCTFSTHQCIANRRCLECKIAIDKNGIVRATKVSAAGKQPNVELNFLGQDGRKLTEKTNHGWIVFPIVSLYVFALSVPLEQRGFLIEMQADGNKKEVFNKDQFTKIQGFWKDEAEDCHYEDWTTDF
jgi:hypothetical protein